MARPEHLRAEHFESGSVLGLGSSTPRLSWSFSESNTEWHQKSYELECRREDGRIEASITHASDNVLVPWPFTRLQSRDRVRVRVRVSSTEDTSQAVWSDDLTIEAGILDRNDWKCSLIEPSFDTFHSGNDSHRPVIFGRSLEIDKTVRAARLYVSAHGIYRADINGVRVGDHILAPGWTSYTHRLLYQTYDVTDLLSSEKQNQVRVEVAEGWFCGRLGWNGGRRNVYGDALGLIAMLIIAYEDGSEQLVSTDDTWSCSFGTRLAAGIYDGETQDLRITPAVDQAVIVRPLTDHLEAPIGPPVRRMREMSVQTISRSSSGRVLLDFGQNFVGRCRAKISGPRGHRVTFRHAEVLENGELGTRPLRRAKATDTLTLSGDAIEWEPEFTFHGFRFVQVEGWPGELQIEDVVGIVTHTDMTRTGHFRCSNPMLNRLHENIVWSMRSNFVSVPTDCPQRDERLGWTGDINVFADTASFLFDTSGVLCSWLEDVRHEQDDSRGIVPLTVPHVVDGLNKEAHAIWGDVIVMLPWSLFQAYGDIRLLERHSESMQKWLAVIPRRANGLWDYTSTWKLGDWLDPLAPADDPGNATTDPTLVSDAFLIHIVDLMVSISARLQRSDLQRHYADLARAYRRAFADEYVTPTGRVSSDTQTAYTLALHFSLLSDSSQIAHAARRLETLVRENSRFRIATGFAGTPYIGHALSQCHLTNLSYRMLLHRECPSWLYPVTLGATTIWERWDSMLSDGSINPGEMTSFNHYALGSVASWMHAYILGMRIKEAGWKVFEVKPIPGGGLMWARGKFKSPQGWIKVQWRIVRDDGPKQRLKFFLWLTVPPNSMASVQLPRHSETTTVGSGEHEWNAPYEDDADWPPAAVYPPSLQGRVDFHIDPVLPFPEDED